jgi:hypothetical protein
MSLVINNLNADFEFQQAKKVLAKLVAMGQLRSFDETLLIQHTLRSEVALSATATSFHIPLLANDPLSPQPFNTENRLALQDIAVVTSMSVCVAKPASTTDTQFGLYNYGDTSVFSSANTATSIRGMYSNGYIKYTNNQQVVLPYWDLNRHYNVPMQQPQTHPYYAANADAFISSYNGSVDGFYPVNPGVIINGAGNVDMNLILRGNLTAVETNQRLVVLFRCVLLQNASSVK